MVGTFARIFWPPARAKYLQEKRLAKKQKKAASEVDQINQQIADDMEEQGVRRTILPSIRERHVTRIDCTPGRKTVDIVLLRDDLPIQTFKTRGSVHKAISHPEGLGIARIVEREKGPQVEILHIDGGVCLKGHAEINSEIHFNDQGVLHVDGSVVRPIDPQSHTGPGYRGTDDILLSVDKYRTESKEIRQSTS